MPNWNTNGEYKSVARARAGRGKRNTKHIKFSPARLKAGGQKVKRSGIPHRASLWCGGKAPRRRKLRFPYGVNFRGKEFCPPVCPSLADYGWVVGIREADFCPAPLAGRGSQNSAFGFSLKYVRISFNRRSQTGIF